MKIQISAIILTYNEEKNIKDCLRSICDLVDEIFIVDSYSTDKTVAIAGRYTDKIYQHPFDDYGKQRNWAQENLPVRNEWILHLDADEKISPELGMELMRIFSSNVAADGFMVPRKTIFRKRWIRYGGHYPAYHARIFKKTKGRCEERLYDQHFIVEGILLKTDGDMINVITDDINEWKTRHKRWASLEAREIFFDKRKKIVSARFNANPIEKKKWLKYNIYYKMPLFIRPFIYFFYRYVLKWGFLDGKEGLVFHFWQGFWYRLLVDIKISELIIKNVYTRR